jgi:hypothetical protein
MIIENKTKLKEIRKKLKQIKLNFIENKLKLKTHTNSLGVFGEI